MTDEKILHAAYEELGASDALPKLRLAVAGG